jgi:DNA replicative helicase MCM subunit Mcm2 (Cdc46/Mcm family)
MHMLPSQGVITHVTDVKPLAAVVVYTDYATGNEVYQEVRPEPCSLSAQYRILQQ